MFYYNKNAEYTNLVKNKTSPRKCVRKMETQEKQIKMYSNVANKNCWRVGWLYLLSLIATCVNRSIGGMPSVGVFLRDPNSYLREN